jgi:predicted methyltransferase
MPNPSASVLRCCLILALSTPLIGGCTSMQKNAASDAEQTAVADTALSQAIAGDWRDPKNAARDAFRHPFETLTFFGIESNQTVLEITPGAAGWYTEILAPYLRDKGKYIAAQVDPMAAAEGSSRDRQQKTMSDLKARLAKYPAQFDRAQIAGFDPKQPQFAAPDSVDTVLTFRNVHNWVGGGVADAYFAGFYAALKPGGVLGVVEHRAKPGTDLEVMKKSGYMTEQLVIDLASKAGFVLDARSEVNTNPKDTADHPNGVWTLPPVNRHDPEDAAMYQAIGESDRMTLRFVKPNR